MKDESGEDLTDATNTLTDLFRKVLDKKDLTVKVENLKDENVSSMVTLSEESRRMQDMMKMYGMTGMDPSMFGGQETLILNAKHPLVQYILKNGENNNTSLFCEQLYDLAMISHKTALSGRDDKIRKQKQSDYDAPCKMIRHRHSKTHLL